MEYQVQILRLKKGFTLIELLVVIGIMAMVIAALFPNFMGARQRARDNQRKSDLKQIQNALELYKSDQSPPVYPTTGALSVSLCIQCWASAVGCTGNVYMRKLPCDPGSGATPTPYIYTRNASDTLRYTLSSCLENPVDPDRDPTPVPTCGVSYTVNEP